MIRGVTMALLAAVFSALCVLLCARGPDWVAPAVISALACTVVCLGFILVDCERELIETNGKLSAASQRILHEAVTEAIPWRRDLEPQVFALQSLCSETARALRHATPESELGRLRERLQQAADP